MMVNKTGLIKEAVKKRHCHVQQQCYHHNRGYCKFGKQCHFPHFDEVCQRSICIEKECKKRHPKPCRHGQKCKFNKANICAFRHESKQLAQIPTDVGNEIKRLKEEIENLKKQIEEKKDELSQTNVSYVAKFEALEKENMQLKVENVVLQKLSAELDESMIFYCDECDFEIEEESALETHKELYHINTCKICNMNLYEEDKLKEHNAVYHINTVEAENKFTHQDCEEIFPREIDLNLHDNTKHSAKPFGFSVNKNFLVNKHKKNNLTQFL